MAPPRRQRRSSRRRGRAALERHQLLAGWSLLAQALAFALPEQSPPRVPGGVAPLVIDLGYAGAPTGQRLRLAVALPTGSLVEAWDDPASTDPLTWEIAVGEEGRRTFVAWVRLPADGQALEATATLVFRDGAGWRQASERVITITPETGSREAERLAALGDLTAALATSTDAGERRALLEARGVLEDLAGVADPECALMALAEAYEALAAHTRPPVAALELRLARLLIAWQAAWSPPAPSPPPGHASPLGPPGAVPSGALEVPQ